MDDLTVEHELVRRAKDGVGDEAWCVVRLAGRINHHAPGYAVLEDTLERLLEAGHINIELDCSREQRGHYEVFRGLLMQVAHAVLQRGGALAIVGCNDKLNRELALCGFHRILCIEGLPREGSPEPESNAR